MNLWTNSPTETLSTQMIQFEQFMFAISIRAAVQHHASRVFELCCSLTDECCGGPMRTACIESKCDEELSFHHHCPLIARAGFWYALAFRDQRAEMFSFRSSDLKVCLQCALLAVATWAHQLSLWRWQVYIPGPGPKQSHVIISPRSQHSSTRRRREAARRRELATCHARARARVAFSPEAPCRVERRPPSSSLSFPASRISPRFLRPSSLRPRPRGPFPRLRSHGGRPDMEQGQGPPPPPPATERDIGFAERAVAAAGAAVVSAILVNPLDVAKTRLQAQAAGVVYNPIWSDFRCYPSCSTGGINGLGPSCSPECFQYRGTMDVFSKVTRQEGIFRLWRGTGASLALAVPTVGIYLPCYDLLRNWIEEYSDRNCPKLRPYAPLISGSIARSLACIACCPIELARTRMQAFKESNVGGKPPGMWKTLIGVLSSRQSIRSPENVRGYHLLWTGLGAQLARDAPYSAICWTVLEPIRRHVMRLFGDQSSAAVILGANFSAGFIAGVISAGATCPLDVAKTRRQIEKDPERVLSMNTRRILHEVWRKEGLEGLFRGAGPRMGRAGPSVGIVVSSYEVVKHIMHRKHAVQTYDLMSSEST